jgi:voltage-gated potassium channel
MKLPKHVSLRIPQRSLAYSVALCAVIVGIGGFGFWILEPGALTLADGMWLAFTTAATVGYGDIVPSTPFAKVFAVFVVLLGFAVFSLVTAAVAATFVDAEERQIETTLLQEIRNLQHRLERMERASLEIKSQNEKLLAERVTPSKPGVNPENKLR